MIVKQMGQGGELAIMKIEQGRRSYDQQCALAYALDLVGERWTLLIVRELLGGPRRYRELLDALPGIGTNLLAERLRMLTAAGVVAQGAPGRRTAGYVLTELGNRLREPVIGLARFGLGLAIAHPPAPGGTVRPSWAALAVEAMIDDERAGDVTETYLFDVDGELFYVDVAGGRARVVRGAVDEPDLTVRADAASFFRLGLNQLDPIEALVGGEVSVAGSPPAVTRCLRLLGLGGNAPAERIRAEGAAADGNTTAVA